MALSPILAPQAHSQNVVKSEAQRVAETLLRCIPGFGQREIRDCVIRVDDSLTLSDSVKAYSAYSNFPALEGSGKVSDVLLLLHVGEKWLWWTTATDAALETIWGILLPPAVQQQQLVRVCRQLATISNPSSWRNPVAARLPSEAPSPGLRDQWRRGLPADWPKQGIRQRQDGSTEVAVTVFADPNPRRGAPARAIAMQCTANATGRLVGVQRRLTTLRH